MDRIHSLYCPGNIKKKIMLIKDLHFVLFVLVNIKQIYCHQYPIKQKQSFQSQKKQQNQYHNANYFVSLNVNSSKLSKYSMHKTMKNKTLCCCLSVRLEKNTYVCKISKISVKFYVGKRNLYTALLRGNALQPGWPAFSCKPHACSQDG